MRCGTHSTSRSTSVVLPAPEGAETMNRRPLLNVLDLLAHLLELGFCRNDELRDAKAGLDCNEQQRAIAAAEPGAGVRRSEERLEFLFRLEDPEALDRAVAAKSRRTPDGKIPVIYRIDMKDPSIFFAAQSFPVHNKDVIYVSNAPLAEFQKFVAIASSLIYPILSIQNSLNNN